MPPAWPSAGRMPSTITRITLRGSGPHRVVCWAGERTVNGTPLSSWQRASAAVDRSAGREIRLLRRIDLMASYDRFDEAGAIGRRGGICEAI